MEKAIEMTLSSLNARHIHGVYAENCEEACRHILRLIPQEAIVAIGDSTGVRQLGVLSPLRERGIKMLNPFDISMQELTKEMETRRQETLREATLCDVFLTGTNAVTKDGRLVNVDATGNRVAGMFWGHPISIVVVGKNKIVKSLDEALQRIKDIIAPQHFRLRMDLGGRKRKTPCAVTGECSDCRSSERGCNVFTIIEGKPTRTALHVVVVNEDLGLGWDPAWPQDRIKKIIEQYKRFVWHPGPPK